jgi:DNA-binding transcriptional MerR regulator
MASFIETYGGNLNTMAHSGLAAVRKAEAAGLSINQIQQMAANQGVSFGSGAQDYFRQKEKQQFTNQISQLQSSFQQQMQQQQAQFAEAQRRQQERMEQMQQQALQAQTRQAAPQKQAQVLGAGKSLTIRPGARTRFSRPELQIKSVNI